jgi:hypothetical protein
LPEYGDVADEFAVLPSDKNPTLVTSLLAEIGLVLSTRLVPAKGVEGSDYLCNVRGQ